MNKIDEMLRMAEITDMKDIPVASKKKNELGMLMKSKILHRGHVKKSWREYLRHRCFSLYPAWAQVKLRQYANSLEKKEK